MDIASLSLNIDLTSLQRFAELADNAVRKSKEIENAFGKVGGKSGVQSINETAAAYEKEEKAATRLLRERQKLETAARRELTSTSTIVTATNRLATARERYSDWLNSNIITQSQHNVLMEKAQSEYERTALRINAYNAALQMTNQTATLSRHHMVNLSYQIQDIGVSLISGQNPLIVFVQQGSQIAGIAHSAGVGIKEMVLALGDMGKAAAFAAARLAANPIVLAIAAATTAAIMFKNAVRDNSGIDEFIESLGLTEQHAKDLAKALKDLGGISVSTMDILRAYGTKSGIGAGLGDFAKGISEGLKTDARVVSGAFVAGASYFESLSKTTAQLFGGGIDLSDFAGMWAKNYQAGINQWADYWKDVEKLAVEAREHIVNDALADILAPDFNKAIRAFMTKTEKLYASYDKYLKDIQDYGKVKGWDDADIAGFTNRLDAWLADELKQIADKDNKDGEKRADYIARINRELDNELSRSRLLTAEREKQAKLDKYSEHVSGKKWVQLSDGERAALEEKLNALEKVEAVQKAVDTLYKSSSTQILTEYSVATSALSTALQKGYISAEKYNGEIYKLNRELEQGLNPVTKYAQALEEARRMYGLFGDDLKAAQQLTPEVRAGMTDGDILKAEEAIRLTEALTQANSELGNIWSATAGKAQTYEVRLSALNGAIFSQTIGIGYYRAEIQKLAASINELTFIEAGAGSVYTETQGKIDAMTISAIEYKNALDNGLITSTQYTTQIKDLNLQAMQLAAEIGTMDPFTSWSTGAFMFASDFKGATYELQSISTNFFNSFYKGFSDAVAKSLIEGEAFDRMIYNLGKTIITELVSSLIQLGIKYALATAFGQQFTIAQLLGITQVQAASSAAVATQEAENTALTASAAPAAAAQSGATFGASAIAGAVALGALLGMIPLFLKGFSSGGYTGSAGTRQVSGVVHGQEFVVNADATKRNRAALEAMNSGKTVTPVSGSGATAGSVTVQQTINVTGNGDKQLAALLRQAASQGAQDGYSLVKRDFARNGSARRMLR